LGDILLIEDDELMRELVAEWLVAAGYPARAAHDAQSAMKLLHERGSALVVTDMHLPGLEGAQTLSVLHRDFGEVPVISISAHFRSGRGVEPEQALALGARKVLAKPFTQEDLLSAVGELIGTRQRG